MTKSIKANPHTDTESTFTKKVDWTHIEKDGYANGKERLSNAELEVTNLQLLQKIDELEAEVKYLKSQNAFSDVLVGKNTRKYKYEKLPF